MADLPTPDPLGQPCTGPEGHVRPIGLLTRTGAPIGKRLHDVERIKRHTRFVGVMVQAGDGAPCAGLYTNTMPGGRVTEIHYGLIQLAHSPDLSHAPGAGIAIVPTQMGGAGYYRYAFDQLEPSEIRQFLDAWDAYLEEHPGIGRPKGSGSFTDPADFRATIEPIITALLDQPGWASQEAVAAALREQHPERFSSGTDGKQVSRWLGEYVPRTRWKAFVAAVKKKSAQTS